VKLKLVPQDTRLSDLTSKNWRNFQLLGDYPVLPRTAAGHQPAESPPQDANDHLNLEPKFGKSSELFAKRKTAKQGVKEGASTKAAKPAPGTAKHAEPATASNEFEDAGDAPDPTDSSEPAVVRDIRKLCETLEAEHGAMSREVSSMADTLLKPSPIQKRTEGQADLAYRVRLTAAGDVLMKLLYRFDASLTGPILLTTTLTTSCAA
jgi:hypothetical protein